MGKPGCTQGTRGMGAVVAREAAVQGELVGGNEGTKECEIHEQQAEGSRVRSAKL